MDAKINIAKILKDKPEGTKLWTDMFGSVTLYVVTDACDAFQVKHHNKEPWFDKDGKLYKEGVLCIYPSKSMRDWEKFSWKKGDVLVSNDGKERVIFEKFQDNRYLRFFGKFFSQRKEDGDIDYKFALDAPTNNYTLEDKDVAQIYINTIEERLGGKLNRQTLEVEKALPEFKDGDIVFADFGNTQDIFIVSGKTNLSEGYYSFIVLNLNSTKALSLGYKTSFFKENLNTIRLATEEEKKQLFDALEKEGKAWDAEKKQIVDLKPNIELKPFDKVLVRDFSRDKWSISFFNFKKEDCYVCINHCSWNQCIPYIGNESLLGTTKDVEG
jgi:hypothetical protein